MQKVSILFLSFMALTLIGCGLTPIPTAKIKHSYTPSRGETISIFDAPCVDEALLKAKEKYDGEPLVLVDSSVKVESDADRQSLMIVCEVEVQVPEAFREKK